jgi:glycosyltransferase involved in cell wall biosynthesis
VLDSSEGWRVSGPVVSVIIPTFNRAGVVTRAIDSALGQTYRPVEVVVVDDGSTDETPEVLKSYGDAIIPVVQDNAGPSAARNRGIRESSGDLIAFLDSDDIWLAAKLERQVDLLQRAGEDVPCCLCDTLMRRAQSREQSSFQIARLILGEPQGLWVNPALVLATRFVLFCQAALIRRDSLLDCGGFDERLWLMEDHDLALRLALRGPWAVIREPLAVWCGENDDFNLSVAAQKEPARLLRCIEYIDRKILEQERGLDRHVQRYLQRDLRGVRRRLLAQRWGAQGRALPRMAARVVAGWDRLRQAWFRRSWSYPRVQMLPILGRDSATEVGRAFRG